MIFGEEGWDEHGRVAGGRGVPLVARAAHQQDEVGLGHLQLMVPTLWLDEGVIWDLRSSSRR